MNKFTIVALLSFFLHAQEHFFSPSNEGESRYKKQLTKINIDILGRQPKAKIQNILNYLLESIPELEEVITYSKIVFHEEMSHQCKNKVFSHKCELRFVKDIFLYARKLNLIDDTFLYYIINRKGIKFLAFSDYIYKLDYIKSKRRGNHQLTPEHSNKLNSDKKFLVKEKNLGKLTPRQRLYLIYTEDEILIMANTLNEFIRNTFSISSEIHMERSNGTLKKFKLSPIEKYRLSKKILDRDLKRNYFEGEIRRIPLYVDLISSAQELNFITNNEVNEFMKSPDFSDKTPSTFQKLLRIFFKTGKIALSVNPVTSAYAITSFLIVDTIQQIKANNDKSSDDHLF